MDSQLPDTPYNELAFNNAHYDIISDIVKIEKFISSTLELTKRLRNRGEDHWHSILFGGGSMNLLLLLHPFFLFFFTLLNFFCLWIANLKVIPILDKFTFPSSRWVHHLDIFWIFSLKLVWQFFWVFFLLFEFLHKGKGLEITENILPYMKLSFPFSQLTSVAQRIILFCHRLSDPCHCTFLYSTRLWTIFLLSLIRLCLVKNLFAES